MNDASPEGTVCDTAAASGPPPTSVPQRNESAPSPPSGSPATTPATGGSEECTPEEYNALLAGRRKCDVCQTLHPVRHWDTHVRSQEHRYCLLRAKLLEDPSSGAGAPPARMEPLPHWYVWCAVCSHRVRVDMQLKSWHEHATAPAHIRRRRVATRDVNALPFDF